MFVHIYIYELISTESPGRPFVESDGLVDEDSSHFLGSVSSAICRSQPLTAWILEVGGFYLKSFGDQVPKLNIGMAVGSYSSPTMYLYPLGNEAAAQVKESWPRLMRARDKTPWIQS